MCHQPAYTSVSKKVKLLKGFSLIGRVRQSCLFSVHTSWKRTNSFCFDAVPLPQEYTKANAVPIGFFVTQGSMRDAATRGQEGPGDAGFDTTRDKRDSETRGSTRRGGKETNRPVSASARLKKPRFARSRVAIKYRSSRSRGTLSCTRGSARRRRRRRCGDRMSARSTPCGGWRCSRRLRVM